MKLLIIRHGAPDYAKDCLTEEGIGQAKKLRQRLEGADIAKVYTSTMGRAMETAAICTEGRGLVTEKCDWLREFAVGINMGDKKQSVLSWDLQPEYRDSFLFDREKQYLSPVLTDTEFSSRYEMLCEGLDRILEEHGLAREGDSYIKKGDTDITLALFCHFGTTCVIAARLLGVAPMVFLTGMSEEPTAVTTICTDDRFGRRVNFRLHGYGDISHLEGHISAGVAYK